jgi:long-chain acyl-CoA synthetase
VALNLAFMLREAARAHPEKPAVLSAGGALSYAELDAASDRFAAGLAVRGLRPGDAVALQLPNVPQFVAAYFGILKAGCVVVPINVLFKAAEVRYVLQDSGARLLVTWPGAAEEAAKGAADAGVQELYVLNAPGVPARPSADRSSGSSRPPSSAVLPCTRATRGTRR